MRAVREGPMPLFRETLCVGRCIGALLLILPSAPTHVTIGCWFALPQLGTIPDSKAKAVVVDWFKDPLTTHENNGCNK